MQTQAVIPAISKKVKRILIISLIAVAVICIASFATTMFMANRAIHIALAEVGGGVILEREIDFENGRIEGEVEVLYNNIRYDVLVDVLKGSVLCSTSKPVNNAAR